MKTIVLIIGSLCSLWMNMGQFTSSETTVTAGTENYLQPAALSDEEPVLLNCNIKKRPPLAVCPGATVTLTEFGQSTPAYSGVTDSNGSVIFDEVEQGSYRYKVTASGYDNFEAEITLTVNTERSDTLNKN